MGFAFVFACATKFFMPISNERPSPFARKKRRPRPARLDADHLESNSELIRSDSIQIERKDFLLVLQDNSRGRFLRITEANTGRRTFIMIPESGLVEFARVFSEMSEDAQGLRKE